MAKTTSSEFVQWTCYLEEDTRTGFHRADYHAALIAAEIRRSVVSKPEKVEDKNFLLRFVSTENDKKEDISKKISKSKNFWKGLVGL